MLYDLSKPIFDSVPQWLKLKPFSVMPSKMVPVEAANPVEPANMEGVGLTTHTGTDMGAPFHFFPQMETVDHLPLSHFHGPCLAVDLRNKTSASGIDPEDFSSLSGVRTLIGNEGEMS